jgi:hypothetical protein
MLHLLAAEPNANFALFVNFLQNNGIWVMIGFIVFVAVGFGCVKEIVKTRAREYSRREIAAYIAEGSMTPEQGERLMRAGASSSEC